MNEAIDQLERGEIGLNDDVAHDARFLPQCVEHLGHKHVLYNAMKEAIIENAGYEEWKSTLNAVLRVLGDRQYQKMFIARCMSGATRSEVDAVKKTNRKYLDWKWEFIEELLYFLLLAMPSFSRCWDAAVYAGTELTQESIRSITHAASNHVWLGITTVIQVVAHALGKEARWISGSPVDMMREGVALPAATRSGHHRRRASGITARDETRRVADFWTGRWSALFAVGEARRMCARLEGATSEALQAWQLAASMGDFAIVTDFEKAVKHRITATVFKQLVYHERLPQRLAGGFAQCMGRPEEESKQ